MKYDITILDGVAVLLFKEENIISIEPNELVNELSELIAKGTKGVVINLKNIKNLNSSGINLLISILTLVRNGEGELVLASISEKINNLLIITKLNSIFNVELSVDNAIKYLNTEFSLESNE